MLQNHKGVDARDERGHDGEGGSSVPLNRILVATLGALALPMLGGCDLDGGSGYLEIKALPPAPALALYLDQVKLDPIRNGTAVLREKAGTAKLQADIDGTGRLALLCTIEIKKNRITSVTVSVLSRQPRCQCGRAGAGDTLANRMCIG
jgi:hypothetical protein